MLLQQRAHDRLSTWVCFIVQQASSKCRRVLPSPGFRAIVPQTLRDPIPTCQSNTLLIGKIKNHRNPLAHQQTFETSLHASSIKNQTDAPCARPFSASDGLCTTRAPAFHSRPTRPVVKTHTKQTLEDKKNLNQVVLGNMRRLISDVPTGDGRSLPSDIISTDILLKAFVHRWCLPLTRLAIGSAVATLQIH